MSDKTKVYAFCNSGGGTDMQVWMAIAETGHVITSHFSSSRDWGIHDVTNTQWKKEAYEKHFGEGFDPDSIEFIVLDEGQGPPQEVIDNNKRLGEGTESEANNDD